MNAKTTTTITQAISILFIFLFTYTAAAKLLDRELFQLVLSTSPVIGPFAAVLSWTIPITEMVITFLLFLPRYRSAGLLASAGLMTAFTIYIGYMLLFVAERPCSCGGILAKMSWSEHLLFNICCTLLAFIAYYLIPDKRFIAINRTSRTPV